MRDVAPIDGILLSPGDQELKIAVDVVPEGGDEISAPALRKLRWRTRQGFEPL